MDSGTKGDDGSTCLHLAALNGAASTLAVILDHMFADIFFKIAFSSLTFASSNLMRAVRCRWITSQPWRWWISHGYFLFNQPLFNSILTDTIRKWWRELSLHSCTEYLQEWVLEFWTCGWNSMRASEACASPHYVHSVLSNSCHGWLCAVALVDLNWSISPVRMAFRESCYLLRGRSS